MMDKKAQSMIDVIVFIVIAFIIVIFFGLWVYAGNIITTGIKSIAVDTGTANLSQAVDVGFGNWNNGLGVLKVVGFCLIFGMILTIFISNFLVRANPVFFAGYILVLIIAVILSMMVSNGFVSVVNNSGDLGVSMRGDAFGYFIISNLPIWVTIIGIIGGILLFAGISRDTQGGTGF